MEELSKFRGDPKEFYEYGAEIFLTKTTKGNQETFYTYTLRYYFPYIAEIFFIDISQNQRSGQCKDLSVEIKS